MSSEDKPAYVLTPRWTPSRWTPPLCCDRFSSSASSSHGDQYSAHCHGVTSSITARLVYSCGILLCLDVPYTFVVGWSAGYLHSGRLRFNIAKNFTGRYYGIAKMAVIATSQFKSHINTLKTGNAYLIRQRLSKPKA